MATTQKSGGSGSSSSSSSGPKKPDPQEEIARRTTDTNRTKTDRYVKVFSAGIPYDAANWEGSDHSANMASASQDAINAGLRITGEITFDGAEPNPQAPETSTLLTYSAPALPAHLVESGVETVGPRDFDS